MLRLSIFLLIFLGLPNAPKINEEHKEIISKTLSFDGASDQNLMIIKNISGSILIEGTQSNNVSVDVEKVIKAESQKDLQEGIRDITLGIVKTGDSIILFTDSPYATLNIENGKVLYRWDNDFGEIDYRFSFDYSVKVPYGTLVDISTVDQGDVRIIDTGATVSASNVNGSVYLEKITAVTKASSVNGVVECEITEKPIDDCSFNTINGDIRITTPSNLSADVSYDAMHGSFYTDFDIQILPGRIERTKESSKNGTEYKIEKNPQFRIGAGEVNMWFKTINGDMILRRAN